MLIRSATKKAMKIELDDVVQTLDGIESKVFDAIQQGRQRKILLWVKDKIVWFNEEGLVKIQ